MSSPIALQPISSTTFAPHNSPASSPSPSCTSVCETPHASPHSTIARSPSPLHTCDNNSDTHAATTTHVETVALEQLNAMTEDKSTDTSENQDIREAFLNRRIEVLYTGMTLGAVFYPTLFTICQVISRTLTPPLILGEQVVPLNEASPFTLTEFLDKAIIGALLGASIAFFVKE